MIALASDCLLFRLPSGEKVPLSADAMRFELTGSSAKLFDPDVVKQAAHAVFYYFRHDLRMDTVTLGQFAQALEKVLSGFAPGRPAGSGVLQSDLDQIAAEFCAGCELFFFPRLREELRKQLQQSPQELHFGGLRGCVKHLAGMQRWGERCRELHERIVEFLRSCLRAEAETGECALLVR